MVLLSTHLIYFLFILTSLILYFMFEEKLDVLYSYHVLHYPISCFRFPSSLSLYILHSPFTFTHFSSFTPDEWEAYSSENIAKAERERKASVALRSEINGILMQTYVDLRNIFETVNNEFTKRIEESLSAKRSLEKELARVN